MKTDEEIKSEYMLSQGITAKDDVGRSYWLKQARTKVNKKTGLYKLKTKSLRAIANKT